jgi:hypothetical protein
MDNDQMMQLKPQMKKLKILLLKLKDQNFFLILVMMMISCNSYGSIGRSQSSEVFLQDEFLSGRTMSHYFLLIFLL